MLSPDSRHRHDQTSTLGPADLRIRTSMVQAFFLRACSDQKIPASHLKEFIDALEAAVARDPRLCTVASSKDRPVGVVCGSLYYDVIGKPHGYINLIYVVPELRRTGLAKELLTAIEACFRDLEVPDYSADILATNLASQKLFSSLGHIQQPTRQEGYLTRFKKELT